MRTPLIIPFACLAFSSAWAQETTFVGGLYPVLDKINCRGCHNTEGVASTTRLQFPDAEVGPDRIEAFGRSLVALIDRNNPDESLLLKKPTARVVHGGGEKIKPGSPEEATLKAWIARLAKLTPDEMAKALKYREEEASGKGYTAPRADLRRLTHSQYNHTVRDLLGDQTGPASQFPPEDFVSGFKNQIQAQSLSPLLIEGYSAAAEKLAKNAFRGGDTHGLLPCKQASASCRTRFVKEFGLKAFRRPIDPAEQKRYEALMAKESDINKGAQLVIEAMLQSPNFLFRMESTSDAKLKPYAAASRISYALWDSMPDAELLAAAGRGELGTAQGVEKIARKMLDHTKAHEAMDEYLSQWLRYDRILSASKDRRKYPTFTRETAVAMTEEARVFVSDLVWNDRNFMDMFTSNYTFVNADLASIYGVPAPAKEFDKVEFPAGSERAGILGQTLFLALTAKPEDSSPTARGLFVREQFLCQHVPDPPPGVNMNLPPVTEAKPQTNRDRMTEHASNATCKTCHSLIDPIGFGLEKFDAVGARREKFSLQFATGRGEGAAAGRRGGFKTMNIDIDVAGYVTGVQDAQGNPNSAFASPAQLGAVLAKSKNCQECVATQYFRYTTGREKTAADRPAIRKMVDDFRKSQFHFKELIISMVLQREFPNAGGTANVAANH